jgi:hypothetical protein
VKLRAVFVAAALATIVAGLAVHLGGSGLSTGARDFLGDALWAMMMVWWVSAGWPRARAVVRAVVALAISWMVELSQLYHSPMLDAVRDTTFGRLTLGTGFDARDLLAYAVGVVGASVVEGVVRRRASSRTQ